MKVKFLNVGRDKKVWDAVYEEGSDFERWATSQIRKHQALMSRDLEFMPIDSPDQNFERIAILAGLRSVGVIDVELDRGE